MDTTMVAFHGDPAIKEKYLARVRAHAAADQIIKGVYWKNGKGCAVGCTVHSDRHGDYESDLGIPQAVARLEDCIFEGLPNNVAAGFPLRFLSAIPVGADLSQVMTRFLLWLLIDPDHGVIRVAGGTRESIVRVGKLLQRRLNGDEPSSEEWSAAAYAASSSSAAAPAYAAAASSAADAAYAASSAADAAYAASYAADAAYAASYAADAHAYAAYAAAGGGAAGGAHYVALADYLIDLLAHAERAGGIMTETKPVSETYEVYSCQACSHIAAGKNGPPAGWVDETWPTIGEETTVRRRACFSCRNLVDSSDYKDAHAVDLNSIPTELVVG